MSKPLVIYPDTERTVVDYLQDAFEAQGEDVDVVIEVDEDQTWTADTTSVVQVAMDDDTVMHPIASSALVRITVWAYTSTEAKRLASLGQGLLLTNEVGACRSEAGPVATRDPDTHAELATFTVVCRLRSTSPPTSS